MERILPPKKEGKALGEKGGRGMEDSEWRGRKFPTFLTILEEA